MLGTIEGDVIHVKGFALVIIVGNSAGKRLISQSLFPGVCAFVYKYQVLLNQGICKQTGADIFDDI